MENPVPIEIAAISLASEDDTIAFAGRLADILKPGDVIRLSGALGAGKTTFARGLLHRKGHHGPIPSPTFTLVETYSFDAFDIWHFDLYRLEHPNDVWELGFEDCLDDQVALIEWPERAEPAIPASALTVNITANGQGRTQERTQERTMNILGDRSWEHRFRTCGII